MLGRKRERSEGRRSEVGEEPAGSDERNNDEFVKRGVYRWIKAVKAVEEADAEFKEAEAAAKKAALVAKQAEKCYEYAQKKVVEELETVKFFMQQFASKKMFEEIKDVLVNVAVFGSKGVVVEPKNGEPKDDDDEPKDEPNELCLVEESLATIVVLP